VGPDLADGLRSIDVGPEVTVGLDSGSPEVAREAGGDTSVIDTTIDTTGPVDVPMETGSPDRPSDISSEPVILVDTRDASPPDGPSPDTADGPSPNDADGPGAFGDLPPEVYVDNRPADVADASAPGGCSNPGWAKSWDITNQGWLAGDKDGNLFVANTTFHDLALGGTAAPITMAPASDSDAIVVRFDPGSGTPVWAKGFGDSAAQTATGVAVDKSGRVGFIGSYLGLMTVGASNLSNLGQWSYGYVGALQAADGTALWATSANLAAASGSSAGFKAIAANPNFDDFVVCGKANLAATDLNAIGKPPLVAAGDGKYDIIVAKIKGIDGSIVWSRQIGGTGDQACTAAAVDDNGNALIAGTYYGTLDFGSGAFSPAPASGNQIPWVAKLSGTDGSTVAAMSPTGPATGSSLSSVYSIDTDSSGNVVIAGGFRNALTFGTTPTLTSAGIYDAFVVKLGSTLAPAWAKRWGDATHSQYAEAAAFDSSGNLTVVGTFVGTIEIGAGGELLTSASDATGTNDDIFLARLAGSTGASACAVRYGDPASQEAYNIVVPRWSTSANKDVTFVSGLQNQQSILDFGSFTLDTTSLQDSAAFWVAKF